MKWLCSFQAVRENSIAQMGILAQRQRLKGKGSGVGKGTAVTWTGGQKRGGGKRQTALMRGCETNAFTMHAACTYTDREKFDPRDKKRERY